MTNKQPALNVIVCVFTLAIYRNNHNNYCSYEMFHIFSKIVKFLSQIHIKTFVKHIQIEIQSTKFKPLICEF